MSIADTVNVAPSSEYPEGVALTLNGEADDRTPVEIVLSLGRDETSWLLGKIMEAAGIEMAMLISGRIITQQKG